MGRYLTQLSTFLAPRSVEAADNTLRQLARWLVAETDVSVVAGITRTHVEDYKVWLAAQPGNNGPNLAKNTQRQRLRMIRIFFERLIEWDWDDAPRRNPIFHGDIPPRTDPLPKFFNDQDAAKLMKAARAHRLPRYRLVVEMLARTGMRASELCALDADAVTLIGDAYWLRIPVGKLRNDRFIPLHPDLVVLLAAWTATNSEYIRAQKRLMADEHAPLDRRTVHRIVATTAKKAGIGAVHPHQLRHTLATQAINRGMRLEAIAALLGHRSMEMTLTYARIADRVVADEYAVRLGPDRCPLQHRRSVAGRPSGRDRDGRHDPPSPGVPRPHAGQRHVHPAGRARLPDGVSLRDLRLFPHRPRVRAGPPPSARPRPKERPDRPGRALRGPGRQSHRGVGLTPITRITPGRWHGLVI